MNNIEVFRLAKVTSRKCLKAGMPAGKIVVRRLLNGIPPASTWQIVNADGNLSTWILAESQLKFLEIPGWATPVYEPVPLQAFLPAIRALKIKGAKIGSVAKYKH